MSLKPISSGERYVYSLTPAHILATQNILDTTLGIMLLQALITFSDHGDQTFINGFALSPLGAFHSETASKMAYVLQTADLSS